MQKLVMLTTIRKQGGTQTDVHADGCEGYVHNPHYASKYSSC